MAAKIFPFTVPSQKKSPEIIQINLGTRCNQQCLHCHVNGSPDGTSMDRAAAELILKKLLQLTVRRIEFTGGAPELNDNLPDFIARLAEAGKNVLIRTNLTVLALPGYGQYFELYRKHGVHLVASLPCYLRENVDRQRGQGVYDVSIAVIKKLNALGYGEGPLTLDLVYNPLAGVLPPEQKTLELGYRKALRDIGLSFNSLIAITNVPVGRFRDELVAHDNYSGYLQLLGNNFNESTCRRLMCRNLVSVDYAGHIYDCDFNLALDRKIKGYEEVYFWDIDFSDFNPEITFAEHCLACTAGAGSSCHGALVCEKLAGE